MKQPRRALISVSDKTGLVPFARSLQANGFELIATGGSAKALTDAGLEVITVESITGFPSLMGGRVKTLHPHIHAGILARRGEDESTLTSYGIDLIDLVVVNLYPFEQTIASGDCTLAMAVEQIDVGGPTLLRAAAKNSHDVTVVVDPGDYSSVLSLLSPSQASGDQGLERLRLAQKAFVHTARYDSAIANYFSQQTSSDLRYGENPHQKASWYYRDDDPSTLAGACQLQGKPLSYNNILDADAALSCVRTLSGHKPACVIVKHETPCGVGQADTLLQAYQRALSTDPVSAFGGIIACNTCFDETVAEALVGKHFVEVIVAPEFTASALEVMKQRPQCRLLQVTHTDLRRQKERLLLTSVSGGVLCQTADLAPIDDEVFEIVTREKPTTQMWHDACFAWMVARHVKSNAIVFARDGQTLGIGSGQTSRVFSAEIAVLKAQQAKLSLAHSAAASDGFFPFADALDQLIQAGARCIIQPGGSKRDAEVIAAADQAGVAMIFTHRRHFKH